MNPRVTVAMSVHNGERFLREAIDSVLAQTFTDFEFIIVDDGSTDSTPEILQSYNDQRMHVINNGENIGLTRSLNNILGRARGAYVARMDADDVSMPTRLERQVAYLDRHPRIGLVGTAAERIDASGEIFDVKRYPTGAMRLRWGLFWGNPFIHPSVMFRRTRVQSLGGYTESMRFGQDVELWMRLSFVDGVANMRQPLIRLRRHFGSISSLHAADHRWATESTLRSAIPRLAKDEIQANNVLDSLLWLPIASEPVRCSVERKAEALETLYRAFTAYWRASVIDRLAIRFDVARRLLVLSQEASGWRTSSGRAMLARAIRVNPSIMGSRLFLKSALGTPIGSSNVKAERSEDVTQAERAQGQDSHYRALSAGDEKVRRDESSIR